MASYKKPKKPSKPKRSATVAQKEAYLKRYAEWKKKCSKIDAAKKKSKSLSDRISNM